MVYFKRTPPSCSSDVWGETCNWYVPSRSDEMCEVFFFSCSIICCPKLPWHRRAWKHKGNVALSFLFVPELFMGTEHPYRGATSPLSQFHESRKERMLHRSPCSGSCCILRFQNTSLRTLRGALKKTAKLWWFLKTLHLSCHTCWCTIAAHFAS